MGVIESWQASMQAHWAQFGSYYDRAAACKDQFPGKQNGMARMKCAADIMKSMKQAKRSARFGGAAIAIPAI